jgi:hypothetical protein
MKWIYTWLLCCSLDWHSRGYLLRTVDVFYTGGFIYLFDGSLPSLIRLKGILKNILQGRALSRRILCYFTYSYLSERWGGDKNIPRSERSSSFMCVCVKHVFRMSTQPCISAPEFFIYNVIKIYISYLQNLVGCTTGKVPFVRPRPRRADNRRRIS